MTIIYGGSFNPPTIAHYEIAKYLILKFPKAKFYFLPTTNSYNKESLNDFKYRVKMLEITSKKLGKKARVSTYEAKQKKFNGTYYSLREFKDPYFVMGADNLETIASWINYENLIKEFRFIIIPRSKINIEEIFKNNELLSEYRNNFLILDEFKEIDLSSSLYRNTKDSSLLLEDVEKYILKNDLYKEK